MTNHADSLVRIVDDDPQLCVSLSMYLNSLGFNTVTYSSGEDYLENDPSDVSGCVFLDIRMQGISGLEVFETMKSRKITLPVIFLSAHGYIEMAVNAVQDGAFSFLEKPPNPEKLVELVEKAIRRSRMLKREELERRKALKSWETLTPSEKQAALIIAKGIKNHQLAEILNISVWTAKTYRSSVNAKLEIENAIELADLLRLIGKII